MATIFANLPTAVGNGSGTPVDVSAFGALKSIVVSGDANATFNIEFNNAAVNTDGSWQSIATFQGSGSITVNVAVRWMRVRTTLFKSGTAQVDIGGNDDGTTFATLPVPATTGVGAAVDVSSLPAFKTVQVGGAMGGNLIVEVSEDGVTKWAQPFSFQSPGSQSEVMVAKWMRVRRAAVPAIQPGTPVVNIGAAVGNSGGGGALAISAGSQSAATGTVAFSNSNGVSFGMSGSSRITASIDAIRSISAGTTSLGGPLVVFSNVNGISFGLSGSTLTASVQTAGGTATGVGISAGTELATTGAVVFSNSNGVSFGMNASTVTASVAVETPFGISAGTQSVSTGTLVFSNSNGLTFGMSGSSQITGSYSQSTAPAAISAGTTSASSGTVVFSNANSVSFGMAGNTVTASISTPPETPFALSAGTQSVSTGTLVFSNSNGLSFGMSGSSRITGSYSQSTAPAAISAGTEAVTAGTVVFSNSNGVTFGMIASTVTASVPVETPFALSAGTQSVSTGTLVFSNSNGLSFGMSGSSQITGSYSQSTAPAAISAGTEAVTAGTVVFSNSNGVTFGMNASTVTASVSVSETPFGVSAGTQSVSTGTLVFSNSNNVTFGMSGSSRITASVGAVAALSAGTTSQSAGTIVFSNSNNVTFGMSGSTLTGSILPGINLIAGTQQAASGTIFFVDGGGVTFGMSGLSAITATIANRVKSFDMGVAGATSIAAVPNMLSLVKTAMPCAVSATRAVLMMDVLGNSLSSGAVSMSMVLYSIFSSTASSTFSGSRSFSWTSGLGTESSVYGGVSGARLRTIPINANIVAGDYLVGVLLQTGNTLVSVFPYGVTNAGLVANFDNIETNAWLNGVSSSTFTSAFAATIQATETNYVRTGVSAASMPVFIFQGT